MPGSNVGCQPAAGAQGCHAMPFSVHICVHPPRARVMALDVRTQMVEGRART